MQWVETFVHMPSACPKPTQQKPPIVLYKPSEYQWGSYSDPGGGPGRWSPSCPPRGRSGASVPGGRWCWGLWGSSPCPPDPLWVNSTSPAPTAPPHSGPASGWKRWRSAVREEERLIKKFAPQFPRAQSEVLKLLFLFFLINSLIIWQIVAALIQTWLSADVCPGLNWPAGGTVWPVQGWTGSGWLPTPPQSHDRRSSGRPADRCPPGYSTAGRRSSAPWFSSVFSLQQLWWSERGKKTNMLIHFSLSNCGFKLVGSY